MFDKAKKFVIVMISPYIVFFLIFIFVVGALFMAVEEIWEEFTSNDGIEIIKTSNNGNVWPLPGFSNISSNFGNRFHPIKKRMSFHDGIDIPAPSNTVIISPSNGVVSKTYNSQTVGNTVEITSGEYKFVFHHMNFFSVEQGQEVKKGEQVGGVGSTGTLSTGPHLHFTVYKNGTLINPLEIVNFNDTFEDSEKKENEAEEQTNTSDEGG